MAVSKKGFMEENTNTNDYNKLQFIIRQSVLGLIDTCFVGIVQTVNENFTVDVLPIVNGVDGDGNSVERSVVYNIPYLRYQGGECSVDIIPSVGDIGLICITKEDSSSAIESKSSSVPPSDKKYNKSNGLYIASIASTCKEAKHSLTIRDEGIIINTTANVSVSCDGNATVNVGKNSSITVGGNLDAKVTGNLNASCAEATITATKATLDSADINLGGSSGKKIALDGDSVVSGGAVVGTVQATSATTKAL